MMIGRLAEGGEGGRAYVQHVEARRQAQAAAIGARQRAREASLAAPSAPAPARLQSALKALGETRGDPTLTKLKVDGIIGKNTVAAVNYAIAQKYMSTPHFPRPDLTLQHVRQFASGLAEVAEGAVRASGGTVPAVKLAPKRSAAVSLPALPIAPLPAEPDRKWIWWAVGGAGVLLLLAVTASAVKKRGGTLQPAAA